MATLMQAHREWAVRPDDERFCSLTELRDAVASSHARSKGTAVELKTLTAIASPEAPDYEVALRGGSGAVARFTNWSFGQLAARVGAPAAYLRTLPPRIAADCLNEGLRAGVVGAGEDKDAPKVGVLLTAAEAKGGMITARAFTGAGYGRIWNRTVVQALVDRFGDGISGDFRVPGEWGKRVEVTKANTTLYASDRDMFVFLADEERRIELPNRRDGKSGSLARGFFVWNSEVGCSTLGVCKFLFDFVCGNRIVWGADQVETVKIRHSSGAPDRWLAEALPAVEAFAAESADPVRDALLRAMAAKLEKPLELMTGKLALPRRTAAAVMAAHVADEQRPIESLWDLSTGLTAYARGVAFQDERIGLERLAGRVLEMAQ